MHKLMAVTGCQAGSAPIKYTAA